MKPLLKGPEHIRIYDNGGETYDRYTVVFTLDMSLVDGNTHYRAYSSNPYSPLGFAQWGESSTFIDEPNGDHLGERIEFSKLPELVQRCVREDYNSFLQ